MSRVLFFAIVCLCLVLPLTATAQCPGQTSPLEPLDEEPIVLPTSPAKSLTPGVYLSHGSAATMAFIQVQGNPIIYSTTTTPTPTIGGGMLINAWSSFYICGMPSIKTFKAIPYSGTSRLYVVYYRSRQP